MIVNREQIFSECNACLLIMQISGNCFGRFATGSFGKQSSLLTFVSFSARWFRMLWLRLLCNCKALPAALCRMTGINFVAGFHSSLYFMLVVHCECSRAGSGGLHIPVHAVE